MTNKVSRSPLIPVWNVLNQILISASESPTPNQNVRLISDAEKWVEYPFLAMPAIAKTSVWTEPKCSYFAAEKNHQTLFFSPLYSLSLRQCQQPLTDYNQ